MVDSINSWIYDGIYLLISEDGANVVDEEGHPLMQYVWDKFWVNNHAHVVTGKYPFATEYIKNMLERTNMRGIVTGAAQPKINQNNLRKYKVLKPTEEVAVKYFDVISPFYEKYRKLSDENKVLKQIRDTLLPKLMSREVRVPYEEVI
jgi:type I restriction enzyme S subunit